MERWDASPSVNQVIDSKGPLKGKGAGGLAQWRKEVEDRLQSVYADMVQLSAESSSIAGRQWSLRVYALRNGKQLRWRMRNSAHATWPRVQALLCGLPPGLAQWYVQAQALAQILNHREQALRYEFKTVMRLIEHGKDRAPLAYTATVGRGAGGGRPARRAPTKG
jgi:hypothetical protein